MALTAIRAGLQALRRSWLIWANAQAISTVLIAGLTTIGVTGLTTADGQQILNRPTTAALAGHGKLGHELAAFGRETKIGFFNAFGYKFYAKKGTSSSTAPTANTGLTEIKNLSNAGISSSSDSQEVITYDTSTNGWKQQIITANSYTISCELNIDTQDSGYKLLKEASRDCATGVMVQWYRETPAPIGTSGPVTTMSVTGNGGGGITASGAALQGVAVTSTSGTGTGLTVDLTVVGGLVTAAAVKVGGSGYSTGETVTIAKAGVAGAANDIVLQILSIGSTGTAETHAGVASVANFSEDIQAGNVAKCSFDLVGYGPYVLTEAT